VIGDPLLSTGAVNDTVAVVLPAVTVVPVGAAGAVATTGTYSSISCTRVICRWKAPIGRVSVRAVAAPQKHCC
jgi:hypothetical protein